MRVRLLIGVAVVAVGCTTVDPPVSTDATSTTVAPGTTAGEAETTTFPTSTSATPVTTATTTTTLAPLVGLGLEPVTNAISQPTFLVSPPSDRRRFVLERAGRIWILGDEGQPLDEPFLDLRDRVNPGGIEQGLLGMAFHPEYDVNGRFFVFYYHGEASTRLVEYRVSATDPNRGDLESEMVLLTFEKPTVRHNGGMLQFGPDGYLYVSLGEGGAASVHSQDPNTLLSSILRLDVDDGHPYAIPPDNPFVDGGGAPEVWAYGLRNPWRFSIDPVEGLVYIADVGHEDIEEVDVLSLSDGGGSNLGWIRMEGSVCFQRGCDPVAEGLTLPVLEYTHAEGCSITGGFVYRGMRIPELDGTYLYSDWCGGWLRSFRYESGVVTAQTEWMTGMGQVNSFGTDADGEIYVLTWEGRISKIIPLR